MAGPSISFGEHSRQLFADCELDLDRRKDGVAITLKTKERRRDKIVYLLLSTDDAFDLIERLAKALRPAK